MPESPESLNPNVRFINGKWVLVSTPPQQGDVMDETHSSAPSTTKAVAEKTTTWPRLMREPMTMVMIAAVAAIVAATLIGGVYHTNESGGLVYVTNRITGSVRVCYGNRCRDAEDITGQPATKTP
jgi:uncharacterized iron-regulated protein